MKSVLLCKLHCRSSNDAIKIKLIYRKKSFSYNTTLLILEISDNSWNVKLMNKVIYLNGHHLISVKVILSTFLCVKIHLVDKCLKFE